MQYKIHHFKNLSSTQDKAKEFAKKGVYNIIITADSQTKARGRFKRKWLSGKGSLSMSILLKPKNTKNLQYLTFLAAISVVNSIRELAKIKTSIKWPNDVHYKREKICGILTEGIFGKENYAIVGIGINVNQKKFYGELKTTAISLFIIKDKKYEIRQFTKFLIDEFYRLYSGYYDKNKFKEILSLWKKRSDTIGRNVMVQTTEKTIEGRAIEVDKECNLLVKTKDNKVIKIVEGDVKLRPFHNYLN